MIHEKWFISDTHFFHSNTWKLFKRKDGSPLRPFTSDQQMHETMIKNWNSVVQPNDYVYHLGDVTFGYHHWFNELMSQLNGKKRLIIGNHDKLNPQCFKALATWFEKIVFWHGFKEHNFTASHIPLRKDSIRDGAFNVHGHTHAGCLDDPFYINVCVEVRDYTPVHLDQILLEIKNVQ